MKPIKRRDLIRRLRQLGFDGPFTGGRHDFMRRASDQMRIPIPRDDSKSREIGVELQKRILREAGISTQQWLAVD